MTILKEVIMKKILCLVMCVFLVIGLSACGGDSGGDISKVKTHDVNSEIYSADDINSAVDTLLLILLKKSSTPIGTAVPSRKFIMQEMITAPIFRNLPTGIMQMKLLCCYLHLMLIHQAATDH